MRREWSDEADWLIGGAGEDAVALALRRLDEGIAELTVLSDLRAAGVTPERTALALSCAKARAKARTIEGLAPGLLLTDEALQQASPPRAAAWRARRYEGRDRLVFDVCAGAGVDALALAQVGNHVIALDVDELRVRMLGHNASISGARVTGIVGDALTLPWSPKGRLFHADPARRSAGRRARHLSEYRPPVGALSAALTEAAGGCILVSPAVPISAPELAGAELEFIQIGRSLVEAAVWSGDLSAGDGRRTATLLPSGRTATVRAGVRAPVGEPSAYLVRPEPAAVRAGLHEVLAVEHGVTRVRGRALLTAKEEPEANPWWTRWAVEGDVPLRAKQMRSWLRRADDLPIEAELHGVDVSMDSLIDALGAFPRGPRGRRLFAVRVGRSDRALFCRPLD